MKKSTRCANVQKKEVKEEPKKEIKEEPVEHQGKSASFTLDKVENLGLDITKKDSIQLGAIHHWHVQLFSPMNVHWVPQVWEP